MPTEGVGKRELPSNLGAALEEVKGEDRAGVGPLLRRPGSTRGLRFAVSLQLPSLEFCLLVLD